ncbi:hypothetical protein GCM10009737_03890 [Nocardioides lentus]|uniref:Uncharacterized protein n=1 Tax=Nocardioides lentus TaxID=338077 RepID=A0ABP5A7V8_9ACTN
MPGVTAPLRSAPAALLLALVASACGPDAAPGSDPGGNGGDSAGWRTSTDPVDPGGLVRLTGTTVHLADDSTVELAEPTETYVVAGDGVFSTAEPDGDDPGSPVLFTAPGESSVDTGLDVLPESLQASPDGRYLAAVEVASSEEEDAYGTPLATVVVLDLSTGEQVVDSTDGMGDTGSDDLADLYSESEIGPLALTDDAVVARTTEGELAWDLATGDSRAPAPDEEVPAAPTADSPEALRSPDGRWRIVQGRRLTDTIEPVEGGRTLTPDPGTDRWTLRFWVDDTTAVGAAVDGPGSPTRVGPDDSQTLMACTVPSGDCRVYDDTTDAEVVFPQRAGSAATSLLLGGPTS